MTLVRLFKRMQAKGVDDHVAEAVVDECDIVALHLLPKKADIDGIRNDIKDVDTRLNAKIDAVGSGLKADIEKLEQARQADNKQLRLEVKADHERLMTEIEKTRTAIEKSRADDEKSRRQQTQWTVGAVITAAATIITAMKFLD